MRSIIILAWSVVLDAVHRKIFYVTLALTAILVMLVPLLPSAKTGVQIDLLREAALGLASIMAFILAIIFGSTMIPGEMEKRTIYNTLSRPLSRWQYYAGKYLGIVLVLGVTLIFIFVVILIFVAARFSLFNPGLFKAIFAIFLEASLLAAVAMLFSVYFSPVVCVFLAILFYIVGHVKGDFLYRAMTDASNNVFIRGLSGAAYYLFPNLERLNINETIAHGERVYKVGALEIILLTGIAIAFTAILIYIGTFMFSRRDL
jgi:ABC-type transport system involved in multi-copper enzyme maturation permease subunit